MPAAADMTSRQLCNLQATASRTSLQSRASVKPPSKAALLSTSQCQGDQRSLHHLHNNNCSMRGRGVHVYHLPQSTTTSSKAADCSSSSGTSSRQTPQAGHLQSPCFQHQHPVRGQTQSCAHSMLVHTACRAAWQAVPEQKQSLPPGCQEAVPEQEIVTMSCLSWPPAQATWEDEATFVCNT